MVGSDQRAHLPRRPRRVRQPRGPAGSCAGSDRSRPIRDHPPLQRRQRPCRALPCPCSSPASRACTHLPAPCIRCACRQRERVRPRAGGLPRRRDRGLVLVVLVRVSLCRRGVGGAGRSDRRSHRRMAWSRRLTAKGFCRIQTDRAAAEPNRSSAWRRRMPRSAARRKPGGSHSTASRSDASSGRSQPAGTLGRGLRTSSSRS